MMIYYGRIFLMSQNYKRYLLSCQKFARSANDFNLSRPDIMTDLKATQGVLDTVWKTLHSIVEAFVCLVSPDGTAATKHVSRIERGCKTKLPTVVEITSSLGQNLRR